MSKKKYFLVIDVETANTTEDPLVYDVGFAVCDRYGKIFETASYIVTDIYDEDKELMESAYYAKKIPLYEEGLKNQMFRKASLAYVKGHIRRVLNRYNIEAVCAYNAGFDYRALNTSTRYITASKYRYFFPYGTKIYCIWHMACQLICTQSRYIKFCFENGFVSKSGNILTNAETVFAYLHKDIDFEEEHTGFQDVLIEVQILAHCYAQHKPFNKRINRLCWRIPQLKKIEIEEKEKTSKIEEV